MLVCLFVIVGVSVCAFPCGGALFFCWSVLFVVGFSGWTEGTGVAVVRAVAVGLLVAVCVLWVRAV